MGQRRKVTVRGEGRRGGERRESRDFLKSSCLQLAGVSTKEWPRCFPSLIAPSPSPLPFPHQAVDADNKQRFSWRRDEEGSAFVRANQGHSVTVVRPEDNALVVF